MAGGAHFPLFFPAGAHRLFCTEQVCRRLGRLGHWNARSKVLEINASVASVAMAREFGCHVSAVDPDGALLEVVRESARAGSVADRVELRQAELEKLSFSEGHFDCVFSLGRVPFALADAAKRWRKLLAPSGRLALTYPVRVGRHPFKAALAFWEARLGEALLSPREAMEVLVGEGFEPESVEALADGELDEHYREVEPVLAKQAAGAEGKIEELREEIGLHRTQAGRSCVTWVLLVARRREPGEKPPPNRDAG